MHHAVILSVMGLYILSRIRVISLFEEEEGDFFWGDPWTYVYCCCANVHVWSYMFLIYSSFIFYGLILLLYVGRQMMQFSGLHSEFLVPSLPVDVHSCLLK
ncbi:hypothetical protein Nepgr_030990 [Nepenthes gracilis]|uniref:Uncharacterized protein n=1 Tax=Nepenthes gracilis TaxID=150966 RepID=A0AAD3TI12_NEPGR|nr:hypothetical protein Nepgr_030990 [Nepenthes gracilis]